MESTSSPATARTSLLPFLGVMVALNTVYQLAIALTGHQVGIGAALGLLVIALTMAVYQRTAGRALGSLRFGRLVAHTLVYVTVNLGFHLHAAWLIATDDAGVEGASGIPVPADWVGPLVVMPTVWGIGLLLHALGSLLDRGFETPRA